VELYPDFYEFHNSLGKALCLQGQLDESISCLRHAIDLDSESALPYQNLWEALARQGRVNEGIECLQRAIELNPGETELYLKLAEALQGKNELAEAVDYYRKAIQLQPDLHWPHYKLGTALAAQGKWEEAIASYSRAAELEPGSAIVHHYLGHTLSIVQRWDEAIESYKAALELAPGSAVVYQHLGDALSAQQKWEQAVGAYRKSVEIEPNSLEAEDHLGFALYQLGRYDEAVSAYRKALDLAPNSDVVYLHLAEALQQIAKTTYSIEESESYLQESISCYCQALELKPENFDNIEICKKVLEIQPNKLETYLHLGLSFVKYNFLSEAVTAYQYAIKLAPHHGEIYHQLGEVLQKKNLFDEAVTAYQQAIALNPDFFGSYHNLGDVLRVSGRFDESTASYQKAIRLNPQFVWSYHNLAESSQTQGDCEQAIYWYKKAIEVDSNFAWSYYQLGRVFNQTNQRNEAIIAYQKALQLDPRQFCLDHEIIKTIFNFTPESDDLYSRWRKKNSPRESDLKRMTETLGLVRYQPLISVIMPVYNTPEDFLREAINSVLSQVYSNWELCIADDNSTTPHVKSVLGEFAAKDSRIKVVYRPDNGHISLCSNSALEIATGEFIALLDHDDVLTPDALYEVVWLLNRYPDADLIYSDEDKLNPAGQLIGPYFKPEWCPDLFLSQMYVCHLGTYRRSLISKIGGFRVGYEGSQDYDLVLRFTEITDKIYHIPKVLYHWRLHYNSAASGTQAKPYAYVAAQKALQEAIERRGEKGKVEGIYDFLGHYSVRYEITDYKLVSIIICTRDLPGVLDQCLTSVFTKSIYPNYEVILIDNGSKETQTEMVLDKWKEKEPGRFNVYRFDVPFNFSKINNYGVSKSKGDYLLFLNNDTEVISVDWIDAMVEQVQRKSIGAVGAKLLYPDDTIQHAGLIMGLGGLVGHGHYHFPSMEVGYYGWLKMIHNVSAVTGACLMCRREVFDSVRGLDEALEVAYNDVDLCLKIIDKGYRNIYLPHVVLDHHESKSRGYEDTPEKKARLQREASIIKSRWQKFIDNDPCYSPNLTRDKADYSIRV